MRNKLRKLVINESIFYYIFTYKYYTSEDGSYMCRSTFKAFKEGFKKTPFTFSIDTFADSIIGNSLNNGIAVGKTKRNINLNCPKSARLIIIYGNEIGWNGDSKLDLDANYDILYKIENISPHYLPCDK